MINPKIFKIILCFCFWYISLPLLKAQDTIRKVEINNFRGIYVKSGISVVLSQSKKEKIEIKGLKTFVDDILVTKNDSGILKFEMNKFTLKNWRWGKNQSPTIFISFSTLNQIKVSECATLLADSVLNVDLLNIHIDDGSELKLNLNAKNLNLLIENGSNIHLYGNVNNFNLTGNNASSVKAFNLICNNINAQIINGTDAELFATQNILIVAKNGSDAIYKGTASKKKFKKLTYSSIKTAK